MKKITKMPKNDKESVNEFMIIRMQVNSAFEVA